MNDFQKQLTRFPNEIKKAFSPGFVFVLENGHFWHFPARQWTDSQVKNYFFERFAQEGHFVFYPEQKLKHFVIEEQPDLFIVIPYTPREDND
ncbi:hypothetical protein P7H59_08235 [Enterococcus viikkiensis]|uniref:Uncharacterized protein n=1 Tax=Enterococcus viikkiensis TaxID=930854 RepID=A0ABU3FS18_9ENTE|nr:hypothetical protein [Enterococcus viikkiensis]MDT2828433.1 hypothetical protein [Enterococcus viikkiensis]